MKEIIWVSVCLYVLVICLLVSFVFCMLSVSLCFKSSLCRHSCICVYLKVCKSIHRSVCLSLMLPAQMTLANCCLSSSLSVRIAVTKIALGVGGLAEGAIYSTHCFLLCIPLFPLLTIIMNDLCSLDTCLSMHVTIRR